MSKFGSETHALGFVALERSSAQPVDPLGTGNVSLGSRMLAQMAARHGQPIRRMFPKYIRRPIDNMVKRIMHAASQRPGTDSMQIVDLRQLSSWQLEPLLAEEAQQWREELRWDYRASIGADQEVRRRAVPHRLRHPGKRAPGRIRILRAGRPQGAGRRTVRLSALFAAGIEPAASDRHADHAQRHSRSSNAWKRN